MREQDWISTDHALPLLLHMLVKLQKIEFHGLEWTEISEDLKQSICLMLELPTLSQIAASTARVNLGVCSLTQKALLTPRQLALSTGACVERQN